MSSSLPATDEISVAVVTGAHVFDVPGFHAVFRSFAGVDPYVQYMDDFAADVGKVRDQYDVVVFYNMHMETPAAETQIRSALEGLGAIASQGIFVLHHAILAYPEWSLWSDLVGIEDRGFGYHMNQEIRVEIARADHPITRGLEAWDMVDETYTMNIPGEESEILLRVEHPRSMSAIAWTHQFEQARVFCLQSGHDNLTYVEPGFRAVVQRGIEWCAGKI